MRDYLVELADEENYERLAKKERADAAVEEYLLGRLERQRNPGFPALSIRDVARKYKVTRGMVEDRIEKFRRLRDRIQAGEVEEIDPRMADFLGNILHGMAEVRKRSMDHPRATE